MIQRPARRRSAAILAIVLAAACTPAVSRSGASDPLPAGFDAGTVEIKDYWRGLSINSPVDGRFRLERQGNGYTFTGTSQLSLGRDEHYKQAGPLPVTIPDSAMRAFLRTLATAPRRPGTYRPRRTHTDDYPELTITLRSDAGVVEFYSASQNDRQPWRVTIGGQQYVSNSTVPSDALRHLTPFMRRAELDSILVAAGAVK